MQNNFALQCDTQDCPIIKKPPIAMQVDAGAAVAENLGGNTEIVGCVHKLFQTLLEVDLWQV